ENRSRQQFHILCFEQMLEAGILDFVASEFALFVEIFFEKHAVEYVNRRRVGDSRQLSPQIYQDAKCCTLRAAGALIDVAPQHEYLVLVERLPVQLEYGTHRGRLPGPRV